MANCKSVVFYRLLLRIKTDSKNSIFDLSERFGASMKESYSMIEMASKMNMNVIGIR